MMLFHQVAWIKKLSKSDFWTFNRVLFSTSPTMPSNTLENAYWWKNSPLPNTTQKYSYLKYIHWIQCKHDFTYLDFQQIHRSHTRSILAVLQRQVIKATSCSISSTNKNKPTFICIYVSRLYIITKPAEKCSMLYVNVRFI